MNQLLWMLYGLGIFNTWFLMSYHPVVDDKYQRLVPFISALWPLWAVVSMAVILSQWNDR